MKTVVVIAGTIDARQIIGELKKLNISVAATVATTFGSELLSEYAGVTVFEGKLNLEEMINLIRKLDARYLVDASHPYAGNVSVNAIAACRAVGIPYLRFERDECRFEYSNVTRVKDFIEAAQVVASYKGNIFLTVGSNNLEIFIKSIPDFRDRLYVRVLPDSKVLIKCEQVGLSAKNIIAMKGPFTEAMNIEMFKACNAAVIVTKDSGEAGGADEKVIAAEKFCIPVIIVERPHLQYGRKVGTIEEVVEFCKEFI